LNIQHDYNPLTHGVALLNRRFIKIILPPPATHGTREQLARQIQTTDNQIDRLVYDLMV
jgi:hypothetical protein